MGKKRYRWEEVTVEKAVFLMKEAISDRSPALEIVSISDALGRVVSSDCHSLIDQPPFDRSPLDGYALRSKDSKGALPERPVSLAVVEEVTAGEAPSGVLQPGQAVRIMTGAPIPEGADCVIRQESTDYGEKQVQIYQELSAYENYCHAGEDFLKGDCLVPAGTRIGAVELGILASMGCARVSVFRKPRIALFTTGDELVKPGTPLAPGKIYNSNLYLLLGRLQEFGISPIIADVLPDTGEKVADMLAGILSEVDFVITTGGVSVGKKDIMHEALELLHAEKIFWKVAVKPGTPTIFSVAEGVPIVSLSGNPFGALTHLELLVRPVLAKLCGDETLLALKKEGELVNRFPKASKGRRIVRAYYEDGRVYLPPEGHASGMLASMRGCNCLLDIPAGSGPLNPGQNVSVILLDRAGVIPLWKGDMQ